VLLKGFEKQGAAGFLPHYAASGCNRFRPKGIGVYGLHDKTELSIAEIPHGKPRSLL